MHILLAHLGMHYVNISGGVEKATCDFANAMVKRGHKVTLLYIDKVEGDPYFPLDHRVHQQNILFEHGRKVISDKLPAYIRVWREIARCFSQSEARAINVKYKGAAYGRLLNRYIEQAHADILVSCSIPSTTYIVNYTDCSLPIVQMIHDDPPTQCYTFSKVEMEAARRCKAMQTLLDYTIPTIRQYFPDMPLHVIGLPVFPAVQLARPGEIKDVYTIACIGNVCDRKNQKFLVEAFAKLAPSYPKWRLEFWGADNSAYGRMISKLIQAKNLGHQIVLKGKTNCVDRVYEHSDIFAIPSKIESFSLSLSEAMAAGLPAVGIKTCNGVNSLIQDGKTGYLTESNIESYCEALRRLMDNADLRRSMGESGRVYIQKFKPEKIWEQWDRMLRELAGK